MGGAFESKPGGSTLVEAGGDSRGASSPGPGKQTLTGQLGATASHPVQRKADGGRIIDAGEAQAHARQGVAGAASSLPHADSIQRAFGRHDLSAARAQVGGAAADASTTIGARAYAQGDRVGFSSAPDLHTAAHEAAHIIQQRAGHAPVGGLDSPGDHLERQADQVADAVVAGRSAEALLDGMVGGGGAISAVQRKPDTAPPDPAKQRRMMELYLAGNQTHVWNVVGDHARSVSFPDPHARLTWTHEKAFVRELLMQLEANIRDFVPLAKLDEILYPSNATRTIGALLPSTDVWSSPLGLAIAQALQIAVVSSLHRLGPRYLAVADGNGSTGDGAISPSALIHSMPIDRYVGAAMCAPHVLTIEPPGAKTKKATGLRPTKLIWEGARDPRLWNWVRATEPGDATAEEVVATLWTVTDRHGETNATFNAYLLAAAPPLFGIPKKLAIKNRNARQYAPAHALAGEDSVDSELVDLAKSSASDGVALHQSPAAPATDKPAELDAVLSLTNDCNLQLGFVISEVSRWSLADHVTPARAFVTRKAHELATADANALVEWNRVITGQRDRLFKISGAIHNLASAAKKLGVKDPLAPDAAPVREILQLLATAAGTSHLAQTSDAKLQQALELQSGLNARAVQATERDLAGAHLDFAATMGPSSRNGYSTEVGDLQQRSRQIQTTMINGGEVDSADVDEVTLRSGEIALRERVLGTIHSTFELQQAAMAAKDGLAAHIAMLFSGKFRSLDAVCEGIRNQVTPIQDELIATEARIQTESQDQVGTPAQKAKHRATRRAVLAKAQAAFARIAADADLQHFFQEGAKIVQNQQFRTACVKAAALIGIAILAAATGGAAAELAGGMLMEAGGVATVAELSTVARVGITTTNLVADSAVNAVGQTVVHGGSLKEAFVENLFMSFASTALFGTIARASAEAARLEGREAMTWAKANTLAQKAFVAGREAGAITVHTVWGAAIGYVAHRVVGGRQPSPLEARDWMLQGASVAIGRGVHASLGARMPGLERLARRHAEARRLVVEAQQLQQLASKVEHAKDPASAVDLLDQRTRLLRDELEAIEHIVARDGDATGELGKTRADLEHQVHESRSQAMLETKLHLLGLEELVPGTLWKGSDDQIQHAIKEARANGGKVISQDPQTKRWKLAIDGREVELQEVSSPISAKTRNAVRGATERSDHTSDGVPDREIPAHEQVTQKVIDPSKQTSKRVTLAGPGDRFAEAAKKVFPEQGFTDVVIHGSPSAFHVLHDGTWVSLTPNSLRTWLKKQGYRGGPIRLLSCEAGAHGNATAQSIANGLGAEVKAPSDLIWVHSDGRVTIGPDENTNSGTWATFHPSAKPADSTAVPAAPSPGTPEPKPHADPKVGAVSGGRQDRRDRSNRLKDRQRELRKNHDPEPAVDEPTTSADTPTRTIPVGMKPEQFARFSDALHAGFASLGIEDVVAVIQGSGATNRGHDSGAPFDHARVSDYDVALVSPTLLMKAEDLHIKLSGPLDRGDMARLGLREIRDILSKMTERPVNFMLIRGTEVPTGIRVP